jgi:hypothetical protein
MAQIMRQSFVCFVELQNKNIEYISQKLSQNYRFKHLFHKTTNFTSIVSQNYTFYVCCITKLQILGIWIPRARD